ncbi:YfhJ family protein [Peribacillus sp. SCS-155]|uniref:YfhJ family protein n=1 Tax=Peribacillus sedimenti TaxID=3115297 RepID=UPI0039064264
MNEYHEPLIKRLLEKNKELSYEQAQTSVELLWEDFEATYAKAGHEYAGEAMTAKVVTQWIENYGERLHEFLGNNPKYKRLIGDKGKIH